MADHYPHRRVRAKRTAQVRSINQPVQSVPQSWPQATPIQVTVHPLHSAAKEEAPLTRRAAHQSVNTVRTAAIASYILPRGRHSSHTRFMNRCQIWTARTLEDIAPAVIAPSNSGCGCLDDTSSCINWDGAAGPQYGLQETIPFIDGLR